MTLMTSKRLRRLALIALLGSTLTGIFQSQTNAAYGNEVSATPHHGATEWVESNTCNFNPLVDPTSSESVAVAKVVSEQVDVAEIANIAFNGTAIWTPTFQRAATPLESSLAAIATTACMKAGVSVEQMVEPFAMVGPHECSSLDQVIKLQEWWQIANETFTEKDLLVSEHAAIESNPATATETDAVASDVSANDDAEFDIVGYVPLVDFDSEVRVSESWAPQFASASNTDSISVVKEAEPMKVDWEHRDDDLFSVVGTARAPKDDKLVTEESTITAERDLHVFGASVLGDESDDLSETADKFAGTAPMIISIDEVYMPYDLAVRDLEVNSLFLLAKRPFCIRSRVELPDMVTARSQYGPSDVDKHDELIHDSAMDAESNIADSEADCLLDDLVWHAESVIAKDSLIRERLRPRSIGQSIAAFVVSSNQVANRVVQHLARVWPDAAPQPPSAAGAQLLVRAAAISAKPDANKDYDQIADQLLSQWITNATDAGQLVREAWHDLAAPDVEVASQTLPLIR